MNLRDLEYLVALADHRHFGRAAEACFVSQPTLSTQIRKLEAELGVALIERNPRHVTLTEVGRVVVDHARSVLAETAVIRTVADQAGDPEAGSIRLGMFPTLAPYLLPHVVPALSERLPRLEVLLVEDKTDALVARLVDGSLDAAALAVPIHTPNLHSEVLFDEDFVLAAPLGHALASGHSRISIDEMIGEDLLLLEDGHCLRDQALEVCRLTGAAERRGFRATSLATLSQMVSAGVGVTLLPDLAVRPPTVENPRIVIRRFADPVPHRSIALFWRPTSVYRDVLATVAQVIRERAIEVLSTDA
ncbi:MAG: LysR family transcriptional regulator [Actinobacteria bacterium]|nr:LysR family transcriptional regulator [Actinomycetota bacterium]